VWEVEYTGRFETWWNSLTAVDTIASSRHANMKELRAGTTRTLFVFDPLRNAILPLGGDKSGKWNDWYKTAVPEADDLYDEHLETLKKEGPI